MSAPLTVERIAHGYAVFKGETRLTKLYTRKPAAREAQERLERERARKKPRRHRPCLTCGQTFLSDGPHNRMCPTCRGRAGSLGPQWTEPSNEPRFP